MTDFGIDLSCVDDIDPAGRSVSGTLLVCQSIARRITTPRGWLIYDQNYGIDLRDYISQNLEDKDMPRVQADTLTEIIKDDRILDCAVTATLIAIPTSQGLPQKKLKLLIIGETSPGPFTLVLSVDAVTVDILEQT